MSQPAPPGPKPLTPEEVAQLEAMPLPPEVEQITTQARAAYFAAAGQVFEETLRPYKLYIRILHARLAKAEGAPPANRRERRAAERAARRAEKVPIRGRAAPHTDGDHSRRPSSKAQRGREQHQPGELDRRGNVLDGGEHDKPAP